MLIRLTFFISSKPSTPYFKRALYRAVLHQKVSGFSSQNGQKKSFCQTCAVQQERFFVEITGKTGILASKTR